VIDARRDASLVEEHVDELIVFDEVGVDAFDGDPFLKAARTVHARKMHAGHATDADFIDDAVASEEERSRLFVAVFGVPLPRRRRR
jgi:hypothetical protein